MIIKLTFFDNDYTCLLEEIGHEWEQSFSDVWCAKTAPDIKEYIQTENTWSQIMLNPNYRRADLMNIQGSDYGTIISILRGWICKWLSNRIENSDEYIPTDFHVSLTMDFNDDWQNGETLYFFIKDRVSVIR